MRIARVVFVLIVLCAAMPASAPVGDAGGRFVGLWVTRWDFRKPEHVRQVIADAESLGVTDVFVQVRGQADALYRSRLEPWCELLLDEGQTDPGFDPLAVAIEAAHQRGLRLHAWINVMPLWKGKAPPRDPSHPFYTKPGFRMVDKSGRPQPLHAGYVTVNPVSPEVHAHLLAVIGDIARRYPVDGVHLDYIRFIPDKANAQAGYPADVTSHAMFLAATDLHAADHRRAYRAWIGARITALVAAAQKVVAAARPGAMFTAAVWRNPELARDQFCQPYDDWMRRGLVDAVVPMIYTDDDQRFTDDIRRVMRVDRSRASVFAGIGVYKHEFATQSVRQIVRSDNAGAAGVCLFAYSSLFESVNPYQDDSPRARAQRSIRQSVLRAHLRSGG